MNDPSIVNDGSGDGSREHTPVPGPSINHPSSTPIKNKTPLQALFSTYTRFRHQTINTLGKEMTGYFTGPMLVNEFLATFLPETHIPDYRPASTQFRRGAFKKTIEARTELQAYTPFVSQLRF